MVAATSSIRGEMVQDHPQNQQCSHNWIESVACPIALLDTDHRVIGWNPQAADLTRIDAHEIIQQPLTQFLQLESCNRLQKEINEIEKGTRQNQCLELTFSVNPEGDRYHIKMAARCDDGGSYGGLVLFFIEAIMTTTPEIPSSPVSIIHENKSFAGNKPVGGSNRSVDSSERSSFSIGAKSAVSKSIGEEAFKNVDPAAIAAMAKEMHALMETANAPIFGVDCEGNVKVWNLKSIAFTGYEKEEIIGRSLIDTLVVPSMRPDVEDIVQDALLGNGISSFKVDIQTKRKEIRHILLNASTRRNAAGEVVGVAFMAEDITEAVHRDRAMKGMAHELRQLIETANAPIFGIDVEGNINEWNRRTAQITGYSKEEAFDEPLVERFIAPEMKKTVEEILSKALLGQETSDYELEFLSKSGEPVFLLVNATTRRDPENVVVGVVGVAQDVTEDKKHREALRQMEYLRASQEAKVETERNMTAYFAHELRNPLGAIDSALNAMPSNLSEEAASLISGMQLCTGFMSSIMNNLLDVRKMEEGKMTLLKAPISLKKIIANVHKMLLPSVRPGVEFIKKSDTKGRDWIVGDSHRVQQVITNVVTNAIKYTVSGSICLSVGWEGDMVKFQCEDTGPGIPKNQQGKLFQRFVQRGGAPGTGLGLAIAKHLVDLNGGSIEFHSDPSICAGTTCVVYMKLPICDEPNSIVEESSGVIEEPLAILIVDDIKMNRMMLKRRIMKGIAPTAVIKEAATGEAALEICGSKTFDVIVVDQYMEEAGGIMVGTDAVFAMRRMRIDAVIIGCSGNDMGTQFTEAGADFVWQKPIPDNKQIIQDIRKSLNERRPNFLKY